MEVISVLPADNSVNHIESEKLVLFCMVCYNIKKCIKLEKSITSTRMIRVESGSDMLIVV